VRLEICKNSKKNNFWWTTKNVHWKNKKIWIEKKSQGDELNFEVDQKSVFASTGGLDFDTTKPVIVLMHGSGLTHIVWSLHEQFLASKGYSILSVDLPGHGSSEGPGIKSIEEIADWIKKSMEKLKINEISFLGHSQGCLVGLEFAYRFPKLIKSLSLIAGSYELPVNPALIEYADGGDMKSVELMMKWGYEGVKKFIGGNPVQKIINSPRQVQEGLAVDLRACNNYRNGLKAASNINCPTLCILGDKDKMVPLNKGKHMAKKIKNSKLEVLKECGHMIIFEKAFEMREIVKNFVEKNHK